MSLEKFIQNKPILVKLLQKWYFASKMVLTCCKKNLLNGSIKTLENSRLKAKNFQKTCLLPKKFIHSESFFKQNNFQLIMEVFSDLMHTVRKTH